MDNPPQVFGLYKRPTNQKSRRGGVSHFGCPVVQNWPKKNVKDWRWTHINACTTAFKKHVLPRLRRPVVWVADPFARPNTLFDTSTVPAWMGFMGCFTRRGTCNSLGVMDNGFPQKEHPIFDLKIRILALGAPKIYDTHHGSHVHACRSHAGCS